MPSEYFNESVYNLDYIYDNYGFLNALDINGYQIFTVFWNLILLLVPYFAVLALIKYKNVYGFKKLRGKFFAGIIGFIWLLFIPNTAYIINDVRHLLNYCPADSYYRVCANNAWMIMFFFTYASLGWVAFVYLVNQMKEFLKEILGEKIALIFKIIIVPLVSLGVLLGLLNRWNSWEIFIYPADFFKHLSLYFTNFIYFRDWLIFSIFLYILYFGGNYLFKEKLKK